MLVLVTSGVFLVTSGVGAGDELFLVFVTSGVGANGTSGLVGD